MRRHTVIGERVVNAAAALISVGRLIHSSHERWDGGYPDGLPGEEMPLGSRIIAACDASDAMVSDRYRPTMSAEEATAELRRRAGTQFDPRVVDALCAELVAASRGRRGRIDSVWAT
jgi:HD-GYP domain-containing protein (c-di-GMP phosphodiesterase class II)